MLSLSSLELHSIIIGGNGNDELLLPQGAEINRFIERGFEKISVGGKVVYDTILASDTTPEEPYDGIIQSARGKGKLKGTNKADAFTFDSLESFTKKSADKIIGFDTSQGDKIAVSSVAFPGLEGSLGISFASTQSKKKLKKFSKEAYDFVYFEKKGRLYFDGNGSGKYWGDANEGGLVAILKEKPELTLEDFTLLA